MPLEHYGTEPPGPNWTSAGEGRWVLSPASAANLRVAVIGGGPGGLFATYILNQKLPNARVTIFEVQTRLGGKIQTDYFKDGTPFESGVAELYEYVGGDQDPLRQLIEDDLELPTTNMSGGAVILGEDILRTIDDVEKTYGADTRKRIEAFHKRVAELMPLEKYTHRWQPDNSHPWAGRTFRDCLREEIPDDPIARRYIETAVHSDLATEPHTCNGLNGIKNVLMDNPKYMQLYHVTGGIGRIAEELTQKIRAEVWLGSRVTKVARAAGESYHLWFRCEDDDYERDFDLVIVAVPNHWLGQIDWSTEILTDAMHAVCEHYDLPAHYLRVSLLYDERWWDELDIPGEFWMMDTFSGCAVYDESKRWGAAKGHALSFLLAGGDALLMGSCNRSDECVVDALLERLPNCMREDAKNLLIDAQVDWYIGSINAQPGGWPAEELRGEHVPEPDEHPGLFLVGDYLFDSTLNAALISANTAVDLLIEHVGVEPSDASEFVNALEASSGEL